MRMRNIYGRTKEEQLEHDAEIYLDSTFVIRYLERYEKGEITIDYAVEKITRVGVLLYGHSDSRAESIAIRLCHELPEF